MTTQVSTFIDTTHGHEFREVHAYGPSEQGFHNELLIGVRSPPHTTPPSPAVLQAVVSGALLFVHNRPTGISSTATASSIILVPTVEAIRGLSDVLGGGAVLFVYSVARLNPSTLPPSWSGVMGGAPLVRLEPELDGRPWQEVGFEIVRVPKGLLECISSQDERVRREVEAALVRRVRSLTSSRLDPVGFYDAVSRCEDEGSRGLSRAACLRNLTRRRLIELRDEYERPFKGRVGLARHVHRTESSSEFELGDADRGTLVLPSLSLADLKGRHALMMPGEPDQAPVDELDIDGSGQVFLLRGDQQLEGVTFEAGAGSGVLRWRATGSCPEGEITFEVNQHVIWLSGTYGTKQVKGEARQETREFRVWCDHHVLTQLPHGKEAWPNFKVGGSGAQHWSARVMFMADVEDGRNWFVANTKPLPRFTERNTVRALVDGKETYSAMVEALDTLTGPQHFLYLAAFLVHPDFPLIPERSGTHFWEILERLDGAGVKTAILLAALNTNGILGRFGPKKNIMVGIDYVNYVAWQQSHQKFMIIHGEEGVVAFCGGIDLSDNRVTGPDHENPDLWHDVHARLEGPAIRDLHYTFTQRFNQLSSRGPVLDSTPPTIVGHGSQYVQVTRTYPVMLSLGQDSARPKPFPFATTERERGTLNAIRRALQRAQRYIYIEDQYLTPYGGPYPYDAKEDSTGILGDLLGALKRIDYLVIVIAKRADHAAAETHFRRARIIRTLRKAFPEKVHVFYMATSSPSQAARLSVRAMDPEAAAKQDMLRAAGEELARPQPLSPEVASGPAQLLSELRRGHGPGAGSVAQLEQLQAQVVAALQADQAQGAHAAGVRATAAGATQERAIYVHSKVLIVDDVYVKIGSANCNRRSYMCDTEADLHIIDGAVADGASAFAREFRVRLWAELLGLDERSRGVLEDPLQAHQFWKSPPPGAKVRYFDEMKGHYSWKQDTYTKELTDKDLSKGGQLFWDLFVDPTG